jgi:UDP-2,4-diacetamido-2,4,6-trideoxy-beta-L-altropyranose hydrolase
MTTVAFRVDADERIGLGHAMRCLALAEALRSRGAQTVFAVAALPHDAVAALRSRGHTVLSVAGSDRLLRGEPYGELNATEQRADALATRNALSALGRIDWIVVDHYRLGLVWERLAAGFAQRVAVIDDHAQRAHDCDLLIDHNVSAAWAQYDELLAPRTVRLLGPRFALLRHEFARPAEAKLRPRATVARLLVSFGGFDPTGETEKILRALALGPAASLGVDVVVGAAHPRLAAIRRLAASFSSVDVHVAVQRMDELIERADLCIGASGISVLERCAKGLPSLLIAVADNQVPIARALAERGAAIYLGRSEDVDEERIARAIGGLQAMPELVAMMAQKAAEVCDGDGARRAAARMLSFDLQLRPAAPSDCERVFAWRNDEKVRRHSLDPAPIDFARHAAWFSDRLRDEHGALLIGEDARGPVGVLRYDVRGAAARVSVYLVPGRHGEGLGALLLHAGHRWLAEHRPAVHFVEADVLADNPASQLAFVEAGYTLRQYVLRRRLTSQE